jgi:hypothetical protein
MLWDAGQKRVLREADDLLVLLTTGTREGMTDVYVALRRLKRKGKAARILQAGDRRPPSFDETWSRVDALATMFPERVTYRREDAT